MTLPAIEPLREGDIPDLVGVVHLTLRTSNAADYPPAIIENLCRDFTSDTVRGFMARRRVFVLREGGCIVATGSLQGATLHSVFVHPSYQGRGHGRRMLEHLEGVARSSGVKTLVAPASLTARQFYRRAGYREVEVRDDARSGRVIVMHKDLAG